MKSPRELQQSVHRFIHKTIWDPATLREKSPRGRLYALLRVLSITVSGLNETGVFSRAAALSYSSILGIGPLVAIAILVAGMVLDTKDPNFAVNQLNKMLRFIAPQVVQYDALTTQERAARQGTAQTPPVTSGENPPAVVETPPADDGVLDPNEPDRGTGFASAKSGAAVEVNPELVQLLNNFISRSKSGAVGAVGAISFIVIVIQLFTSVENAFNAIWGVRRGRSFAVRVVMYWTVVTLGAVLAFAALSLLAAGTVARMFDTVPFGAELLTFFQFFAPLIAFMMLVALLTLFYRFIPNTNVGWIASAVGAVVVVLLLFLNNYLSFLYVKQVVGTQSLFGSLTIVPILMLGLYIFWLFVLVGGQITYAVQNMNFRSSQAAWTNLNHLTRESLALLVLLVVSRRFKECNPALTASEIGNRIRVPTQVLNECLNRLRDLQLVSLLPPEPGSSSLDYRYQPAKPLNRVTLLQFKELFDQFGESPAGDALGGLDPILLDYRRRLARLQSQAFGEKTFDELIEHFPADFGGGEKAGAAAREAAALALEKTPKTLQA